MAKFGVARAAAESGAAAGQVFASAEELNRQVAMLRVRVDEFLANVRAA